MKRISLIAAGSLAAILIACGAASARLDAQNEPEELFAIPFAFSANGHYLAAGTYQVHLVSNQYLMSLRNVESGEEQFFSVRPEQQHATVSKGLLVFHQCGEHKDLMEFHNSGTNLYSATIPARARKGEADSCSSADTMTVAAR